MSKQEMLQLLRLLSAMETCLLQKCGAPDHIFEQLDSAVAALEREIIGGEK